MLACGACSRPGLELDMDHPGHGGAITTCVLGNIDTESAKEVGGIGAALTRR